MNWVYERKGKVVFEFEEIINDNLDNWEKDNMPSKSKIKGNRYEYEIRDTMIEYGMDCTRAYASDGRSLGLTEDIDLVADDMKIQCKRRKAPKWMDQGNADWLIHRGDNQKSRITMDLEQYLEERKESEKYKKYALENYSKEVNNG
jgi:hypothetical protein